LLSGKLLDKNGNPVEAEILCKDISNNEEVGSAVSNPETGEYKLVLQKGKVYNVDIKSEQYYTSNENIDLTKLNYYTELNRDLLLQPLLKDEIIKLKNISFEFNMSIIKVESYSEINRLVDLLSKNPSLKIEIAIHTDDDGPSDYNLKLSQSRADAVVNYMKSKGIKPNRMIAKGYGEANPIVPNDSSANREINRRIEIKVL
jgi:outer membrane protein OmpA-like peptidoglycan-associated protein